MKYVETEVKEMGQLSRFAFGEVSFVNGSTFIAEDDVFHIRLQHKLISFNYEKLEEYVTI